LLATAGLVLAFSILTLHAAVKTTTIQGRVVAVTGSPLSGYITAALSTSGSAMDGTTSVRVVGYYRGTIDPNGMVTGLALVPNDAITPGGTYYVVSIVWKDAAGRGGNANELWSVASDPNVIDIGLIARLKVAPGLDVPKMRNSTGTCPPPGSFCDDASDVGVQWLCTDLAAAYYCQSAGVVAQVSGSGSGYNRAQEEGSNLTPRTTVNFVGVPLTVTDNPSAQRTDVTLSVTPSSSPSCVGSNRIITTNQGMTGGGTLASDLTLGFRLHTSETGGTPAIASESGLQMMGSLIGGGVGITLLAGCSDGQILKWDIGEATWNCADDGGVGGGGGNSFTTINAPSGTDPVASGATDTLGLSAVAPVTITGDALSDTLTFQVTQASASAPGVVQLSSDLAGAGSGPTSPQVADDSHNHTTTTVSALDASNDFTAGLMPLLYGGTGSNLSGTGGTGQFLKQSSAGAGVTVSVIGVGDLPAHAHTASDITSGSMDIARGGTTETVSTEDAVLVGSGSADWQPKVIPDCDIASGNNNPAVNYDQVTNTFTCRQINLDPDHTVIDPAIHTDVEATGSLATGDLFWRKSSGKWSNLARGTNGQCLTSTATDLAWGSCAGGGGGYATIQEEGSPVTVRTVFNLIGAALTAADNAGASRTDVTLSQSPASASVVGTGRLVSVSGTGLSGGGDLSADLTITLSANVMLDNEASTVASAGTQVINDPVNILPDATNGVTVDAAGLLTKAGTGSVQADAVVCSGSCISDAEVDDGITISNMTQIGTRPFTSLTASCTDAQVVGGNAGATALECQADDDVPDAGDFGALALSGDVASTGLSTTIGADKILESMLKVVDSPADEECLTYEATGGDFQWETCGAGGSGDITDVFNCASGDCASVALADGDLLDGSGVNNSATTEGIKLPQAADVSTGTAEGQIGWDTDDDTPFIGDGSGVKPITGRDWSYFRQVGTSPVERLWSPNVSGAASLSQSTFTTGVYRATPFLTGRGGTIDRVGVRVTTGAASTNFRICLYDSTSDTNLYPNNLILDVGSLSSVSTGWINATVSQALKPGKLYWFAFENDSASPQFRSISGVGSVPILGYDNPPTTDAGTGWTVAHTFGACPSTFPASGTVISGAVSPVVNVRYSN
jgi:hypothetical protein